MLLQLSLQGRSAIVTGGGRGIGKAIALALAEAGADIVVAARTVSEIETTAEAVRAFGRQAIAVPTDVTRSAEVEALVDRALRTFGKVDIMVNNAGNIMPLAVIPLPGATLKPPVVAREGTSRTSDEEWRTIIAVNLDAVLYGCRAVAPHMLARKYGKIINISSIAAHQAYPLWAAYNASKAAVNMLTRVLALEWADYNICVNAIGPGWYHTALNPIWDDPVGTQEILDSIPFHRSGELNELGVLAVYLASAASDFMTGQVVYIDGGSTAR